MDRCKYCGEPLTERNKFCPNCGQPREADPTPTEAEFELEEAEFELEEPEEQSAAQSPEVDHVIVTHEAPKARPEKPKAQPEQPREYARQTDQPSYTEPPKYQRPEPAPVKKHSKRSIWAFILVITIVASLVGVILAIVDLAKKDSEHKHGLSVAALIICGVLALVSFVGRTFAMPKLLEETGAVSPTAYSVQGKSSAKTTAKPASKATAKPATKVTAKPATKATQAPQAAKTTTNARVVSILYGNGMLAGLREDGTVALTGFKRHAQHMDVSGWTDIVYIDTDYNGNYLVGLKGDGTVVATGEIRAAALQEMASWRNIVFLETGDSYGYVLGVRADGTVVGVKVDREPQSYDTLIEEVGQWTDVASVKVFSSDAYARKKDGTLINTESSGYDFWTRRYEDLIDIYNTGSDPVLLYLDGTIKILAENMEYDISGWQGMQKLLLKSGLAVGLKKDGTVVAVCSDRMQEYLGKTCSAVLSWRDIVDIAADGSTVVGLKRDGSLVFAGSEFQYKETEWTQTITNVAQNDPRLTPAPMRAASRQDDSAAKKKAVERIQYMEKKGKKSFPTYTRRDYVGYLRLDKYSDDVIWYALDHSGIDWKAYAVAYVRQKVLEKEKYRSAKQLMRDLRLELFSEEEIAYAKAHWNLNFKEIAVKCAQHYIASVKNEPWTKERMIRQLESEWFTPEEAAYAAGKLGLK